MEVAKNIFVSSLIGLGLASGAAIGIFTATLGMCAVCLLGAG